MNARNTAIARQDQQIEESRQRALAAREGERKPRTALEAMASRLHVTPQTLQTTLRSTVFSACRSNEEFVALVVVANEFGLNPLLKEIYAFPSKGGGITPMVSIDGWIRLMNSHPDFNGIKFDYHFDAKGDLDAVESIIYRKSIEHPVCTIEFMSECKGDTIPWRKSPRRMLRHRALIQGARIAFGFSGMVAEGEEDFIDGGNLAASPATLPPRQSFAEELDDEIPAFDGQTGEVFERDERGMSVVDEETERALDSNDGTLAEDNPTAAEGPADEDRGEANADEPAWFAAVRGIRGSISAARTLKAIEAIERDWTNRVMNGVTDESAIRAVDGEIAAKKAALKAGEA